MRKYKVTHEVTLCFHLPDGELVQHCMEARAALLLARDLQVCKIDAEVWPVDQFGRRTTADPIVFADLDFS